MNDQQYLLTVRDYLRVVFRHKGIVFLSIITVMATVVAGVMLRTPVYSARVKMLISGEKQIDSPYYRDLGGYSRNGEAALTQSEIVTSAPVIEMAVRALKLWDRPLDYETSFATPLKAAMIKLRVKKLESRLAAMPPNQQKAYLYRLATEDLRSHISVSPIRDTSMFTIAATDYSPVGAAIIANLISRSYIIFDLQQQAAELELKYGDKHPMVSQLKNTIADMEKRLSGEPLPNIEAIGPASVKVIEQADLPLEPEGPSKGVIVVLGMFMSLFLSVMLAFMFEYMDQSFKTPRDIEQSLSVPLLGSVRRRRRLQPAFYRELADHLFLMNKGGHSCISFMSAVPREGVSSTVANLGSWLAEQGKQRVLLIDANLRNSTLHKLFKLEEADGLADVIEGRINIAQAVTKINSNLSVMTAGRTSVNPLTLLTEPAMADTIKTLRANYDLILIDTPALSRCKDAAIIAGYTDGSIIVIHEGRTRRPVVLTALTALKEKKNKLLGAVLNKRTYPIPGMIYKRV